MRGTSGGARPRSASRAGRPANQVRVGQLARRVEAPSPILRRVCIRPFGSAAGIRVPEPVDRRARFQRRPGSRRAGGSRRGWGGGWSGDGGGGGGHGSLVGRASERAKLGRAKGGGEGDRSGEEGRRWQREGVGGEVTAGVTVTDAAGAGPVVYRRARGGPGPAATRRTGSCRPPRTGSVAPLRGCPPPTTPCPPPLTVPRSPPPRPPGPRQVGRAEGQRRGEREFVIW